MPKPKLPRVNVQPVRVSPWLATGLSVGLMVLLGYLDYIASWQLSFTFFYLIPIFVATWLGGRTAGIAVAVGSAAAATMANLTASSSLGIAVWNAGIRLGVFLTVFALLNRLKARGARLRFPFVSWRPLALVAVSAFLVGTAAIYAQRHWLSQSEERSELTPGKEATASVSQLAADLQACLDVSRPILLGSRDPNGPSCVQVFKSGQIGTSLPKSMADLDGGPGTKLSLLYVGPWPRGKSPEEDFAWHQTRLKTFLENLEASNREPGRLAGELAGKALAFSQDVNTWTSWPADFSAPGFSDDDDWPSYCLASLNEAVAAKNLEATKHWAAEFASATFAVDDLHRWLAFLVANHLTALEFQAKCESLFTWAQTRIPKYDPLSSISCFPAGMLGLHGLDNYYEVERQAEMLFHMPKERFDELAINKHLTAGSVWVLPGLRETFLELEKQLSPSNKETWELAARTPYEHSYFTNMLYRADQGAMVAQLGVVLQRFNANYPQASLTDLMGVLMYRGHSFAGLEWPDRFQPQLMDEAADFRGSDREAFLAACKATHDFYGGFSNYGRSNSLREAIEQKKLDCVRATDMLGAIYRNTGRPRFGHVRWSAGTTAHSVASMSVNDGDRTKVLLLDALTAMDQPEVWPGAYFNGHVWPPGMETNPPPYAAELYIRGIDNYIWAEGYIIRDVNAGTLMKAAVPYLARRDKTTCEKVFNGPYPP